jgi:hypothetical protein
LHSDCGRHSCCCWRPLGSRGFPVAIADVPGVTNGVVGVSAVPFEHAVAGMLLLAILLLLDFLLLTAFLLMLSDNGYRTVIFFCYQTIGISNMVMANSRNYRTIGYQIKASIYRTIGYRTKKNYRLPTSGNEPRFQSFYYLL